MQLRRFNGWKIITILRNACAQAQGHTILTVEGLNEGKDLNPIQKGLWKPVRSNAVSVRRMVLATKALLDKNCISILG